MMCYSGNIQKTGDKTHAKKDQHLRCDRVSVLPTYQQPRLHLLRYCRVMSSNPREGFTQTQYALYAEEIEVPEARKDNDKFLLANERYKRDIYIKENLQDWQGLEFPSRVISKQD